MKISSIREFRDNASSLLRSGDPALVTRRGRLAGIFFPRPEATLPAELKREFFSLLSTELARRLKRRRSDDDELQEDFESWRKSRRRREAGGRR